MLWLCWWVTEPGSGKPGTAKSHTAPSRGTQAKKSVRTALQKVDPERILKQREQPEQGEGPETRMQLQPQGARGWGDRCQWNHEGSPEAAWHMQALSRSTGMKFTIDL